MENYFELFEAAELRAPTVVRAEIAELKQKIEKAQKNLIDVDNRIAGYSKDTDPKHANTVANKIRSAEREKKETTARVDDYNKRIKELEEEVRAYFRQKAEKEIDRSLGNDQENSTPPKKITVSYSDIVAFLIAKNATISFESASDKVNKLKWLLPDLEDDQIKIISADKRTSGGYRMKFGISGYIRVSDLEGLPAGYYNYFNGNAITEIDKVVAIVRSNFEALSPLIITHETVDDEDVFKQEFPDINAYGEKVESLKEAKEEICCICGEPIEGYGNNPRPYKHEGRCCDACQSKFVLPARLANINKDKDQKDNE